MRLLGSCATCRTGIELEDPEAPGRRYPYYDQISTLGETGQKWWADQT